MTVKLAELSPVGNENRSPITPLLLPAGVPPVATTVPGFVPPVVSTSWFVTVWVPLTWSATVVVLPSYVIDDDVVPVTLLNTLPAAGVAPVIVLPFAFVSTRMPKYTWVWALVFTPVHVHVPPVLALVAVPLRLQLPPPGSV